MAYGVCLTWHGVEYDIKFCAPIFLRRLLIRMIWTKFWIHVFTLRFRILKQAIRNPQSLLWRQSDSDYMHVIILTLNLLPLCHKALYQMKSFQYSSVSGLSSKFENESNPRHPLQFKPLTLLSKTHFLTLYLDYSSFSLFSTLNLMIISKLNSPLLILITIRGLKNFSNFQESPGFFGNSNRILQYNYNNSNGNN